MKKIVLAAVMLLSSVSMFAQHEVGTLTIQPKVGLNVSNVTKTNGDTRFGDSRFLVGIGIYFGKPKKKETFIYNSS